MFAVPLWPFENDVFFPFGLSLVHLDKSVHLEQTDQLACSQDKNDDLAGWKRVLTSHIQGIHVCTHYSIKNNYYGGSKGAHEAWVQFCEGHASGSILLVSGGGKKKAYDTIDALKGLPHQTAERVDIHVAFNPYLVRLPRYSAGKQALALRNLFVHTSSKRRALFLYWCWPSQFTVP